MAYSLLIQATLAVDFDVGFAIKEKVRLHTPQRPFRFSFKNYPSRSSLAQFFTSLVTSLAVTTMRTSKTARTKMMKMRIKCVDQ